MAGPRKTGGKKPPKDKSIVTSGRLRVEFIGSFFELNQIPKDKKPQIAVAGRSNVGKSSLLNLLLGSKKIAKVSSTPGKTRSLNFFDINNKFYFVDLPGYGYAKVPIAVKEDWGRLIEDYLTNCEDLKGLILLLDCRRDVAGEDQDLIDWLAEKKMPVLIALTKGDKLTRNQLAKKVIEMEKTLGCDVMATSASKGIGKKELSDAVFGLVG